MRKSMNEEIREFVWDFYELSVLESMNEIKRVCIGIPMN